jgi:hypothetical protein
MKKNFIITLCLSLLLLSGCSGKNLSSQNSFSSQPISSAMPQDNSNESQVVSTSTPFVVKDSLTAKSLEGFELKLPFQ